MKKSLGPKTVVHPTPVFVIGTYDAQGKANAMTASWAGICCSLPPCVSVSLRKATYTYGNIIQQRAFTVNIPSEDHLQEADYLGLVSGRTEDKLRRAKLTPVRSTLVNAPYILEFPLVLECQLLHTLEIGLHTLFVGEIKDIKADESIMTGDLTDVEKLRPLIFDPDRRQYYAVGDCIGQAFAIGKLI